MLSKAQRKKIYERVSRRYRRYARKLGKKNWREVELNGLYFKDAYELELKREEYRLALGKEPSNLKPSRSVEREVAVRPKRKSNMDWITNPSDVRGTPHAETCTCNKCMGGFGDPDLIDSSMLGESEERREARKQFEREVNERLEQICTSEICPVCKSSVCRCGED